MRQRRGRKLGGVGGGGSSDGDDGGEANAGDRQRGREGSSGDQWTQPRGALHSLGYYVVSYSHCVVILCQCYVLRLPLLHQGTPSVLFSLSLLRHACRLRIFPSRVRLNSRAQRLSSNAPLYVESRHGHHANFDPPMATRRRLPRAGKLISTHTRTVARLLSHTLRFRPSHPCFRTRSCEDMRAGVEYTSETVQTRARPPSGDENSQSQVHTYRYIVARSPLDNPINRSS